MKDTQNITIVLLLITAAILLAMVIGTYNAAPANADIAMKSGSYAMISGERNSSVDYLYVIEMSTLTLNAYEYNSRAGKGGGLDVFDAGIRLEKYFEE